MSRLPVALALPVVLAQASRLRRDTPRLPPPAEPWHGTAGAGDGAPTRSLLVFGDSTAIGTGTDRAEQGLAGALAAALAERDGVRVAWRAAGRNGATSAEIRDGILPGVLDDPADTVVVVAGWNDALRLRSARAFARDLAVLVRAPAARAWSLGVTDRRTIVVAAPAFDRFPVLPDPLRWALGAHAAGLRRAAARVAATWGATPAPGFDGASTASDRFHPDADGYAVLAAGILPLLRR